MIIQAIKYGEPPPQEFAFEYSGNYTDNRDENGIGTVTLNTSGTLTVTGESKTVSAYIRGGGGGGVYCTQIYGCASGGGGGYQTVSVELAVGTYEIIIGTGGAGKVATGQSGSGGNGGNTTAFGYTSTGGGGGVHTAGSGSGGAGGTPNGIAGTREINTAVAAGGTPNGGAAKSQSYANNGGDGYVELTFS